jgi:hypothetical protein
MCGKGRPLDTEREADMVVDPPNGMAIRIAASSETLAAATVFDK